MSKEIKLSLILMASVVATAAVIMEHTGTAVAVVGMVAWLIYQDVEH